jgi:hypothetical protein
LLWISVSNYVFGFGFSFGFGFILFFLSSSSEWCRQMMVDNRMPEMIERVVATNPLPNLQLALNRCRIEGMRVRSVLRFVVLILPFILRRCSFCSFAAGEGRYAKSVRPGAPGHSRALGAEHVCHHSSETQEGYGRSFCSSY